VLSSRKEEELRQRMEKLGILDEDLVEKFIRGSGSGGQKVNKTASCVYLKHEPSGFEIKCQQDRSRVMNRYIARKELCEQLEEKAEGVKSKRQQLQEKIRRQKRRRSRRQRQRDVGLKRQHGEQKQLRKKPSKDD
jgi:protein subunit release factor B